LEHVKIQVSPAAAGGPSKKGNKLNVLCLHGTTMSGSSMKGLLSWKECGVARGDGCADIAQFFYPDGPCVVTDNHPIWKMAPQAGPPGPNKRHWWKMTNKWDFGDAAFKDARQTLCDFVDNKVEGPVDVILGYSQGAAACTMLMNDVLSGKVRNAKLAAVKGIVFLGCPSHPKPNDKLRAWSGSTLHCNGKKDPLTPLKKAKEHAQVLKNNTFFEYDGTHGLRNPIVPPIRKFLQSLS